MKSMHILSRACNQPQLLEPGYAATFFSYLGSRNGVETFIDAEGNALDQDAMTIKASSFNRSTERNRPYQVVNGIAILPVSGTLLHKYGYVKPYSGCTGYDGIIHRLEDAIQDSSITGVMLDIDSPGGELAGCFDTAAKISQLSKKKPIYALCYDTMCSAAMMIGAACTERWITQSGRAGSVGVVVAHTSVEKKLEEDGIKITLLHSGKHKVDGNPYEELPDDVRSSIQENLDRNRDIFAHHVSDYIGMTKQAVLDTEAKVYEGQAAIDAGLADRLVNGAEAIPLLIDVINNNRTTGVTMSQNTDTESSQSEVKATKGDASNQSLDEGAIRADAVLEERKRCESILNSDEAKNRASMASHLAFKTDMSSQEAIALLGVSPESASNSTQSASEDLGESLDNAMNSVEQPNLQSSGDAEELSEELKQENSLLSSHNAVTGA